MADIPSSGNARCTLYRLATTTATTNGTLVSAAARRIVGGVFTNLIGTLMFLKIYDKATAPVVGTDVPIRVIALPAGLTQQMSISDALYGLPLVNGLAFGLSLSPLDAGALPIVADAVTLDFMYTT